MARYVGEFRNGKLALYGWDNLSTNDGPGVRLALYFKGCSLSCPWCLNPYLQKIAPEIRWNRTRCELDLGCVCSCPNHAITCEGGHIQIHDEYCNYCGVCWEQCKGEALKPMGQYLSLEQIVSLVEHEINLQLPPRSVTVGGGEPLLQGKPMIYLLDALKELDVHILVSSCAGISNESIWKDALARVDGILLQLFTIEESIWRSTTAVPFDTYLRNLNMLALSDKPIYLRIPIVPGFSDDPERMCQLVNFIKKALPNTMQIEFRGYSNQSSYTNPMFSSKHHTVSTEKVIELCNIAKESGLRNAHWRGAMRNLENSSVYRHPYKTIN